MGIHRKYSGTLTRNAVDVSGSEIVSGVGGKPTMIMFSAIDNADTTISSDGMDDSSNSVCTYSYSSNFLLTLLGVLGLASLNNKSHTKCIFIQNSGTNGHSANVASFNSDGFTLNWTRIGTGRDITIKYIIVL